MHRLVAAVACAYLVFINPALAYDIATPHIIGFSEDGTQFAFEEYGITESEGDNVYANIYVIDTRTDEWISGTPIRHAEDGVPKASQETVIKTARAHALEKAKDALKHISAQGRLIASNPLTEMSGDPHAVSFCYHANGCQKMSLKLDTVLLPATTPSNDPDWTEKFGGKTAGFRLTLEASADPRGMIYNPGPYRQILHEDKKLLHEDKKLPESRGQALDYRISDVVFYQTEKVNVLAVLLMVFEPGWEGENAHFIAVTAQLPQQ